MDDHQKPVEKWLSQIEMETLVDNLINKLANENDIFNLDYETYNKHYGFIHFKTNNNILLINFKSSKRPRLLKNDKIDSCCVCYEDCNRTLKCGHYICKECIQWIQTHNTCPMCRQGNNYNIGYIFSIPFKAIRKLIY